MTYEPSVLDAQHNSVLSSGMLFGARMRAWHAVAAATSTAWPANNDAYLVPFVLSAPTTFTGAYFLAGTSPGTTNYDLGIYRDDFTRIISLGATAAANTTDSIQLGTFSTAQTLVRGRYYLAMSSAATTLTTRANTNANQIMRAFGMFKMATAHPLPNPFVPASMGATAFLPTIGLMTAANTVL